MEHEFWHQRWANNEIGFHQGTVNQYLHDHWSELAGDSREAVLVPLCGKSHDMWWLHDLGHPVLGVELSEIACKDFFREAGEKAQVHPGAPFTRFCHDNLELWCGDFFRLVADDLHHIRLVYDRAALIALPPDMRRQYVQHLHTILPAQCRILLITLDYRGETSNPPFNVGRDEVEELYGPEFSIECLRTNILPRDHPFVRRRGLDTASENVFRLTRQR